MSASEVAATAESSSAEPSAKGGKKTKWALIKKILTIGFFIFIPLLIFLLLKNTDWQEVKKALQAYEFKTLLLALLVSVVSFLIFSSYDLLARKYTQHSLPTRQVWPLAFVCCAFNLNLSWMGGVASRYRLYSRLGLDAATITKILSINIITNWLGYIIVAGTVFALRILELPDNWKLGETALQIIGVCLLLVAASYFFACHFATRRTFHIFKHEVTLPSLPFALIQASLAAVNWCLMAFIVFILLLGKIAYPTVLGTLLISSIAGVIAHIPAGLGVIEAVFVALLHAQLPKGNILAALVGYRVVYFLIPLAAAFTIYLVLEARTKKLAVSTTDGAADRDTPSH